jgi:hypothetical protein
MRYVLMMTAALGLLSAAVPSAYAQKIDANGRCHAKDGKFAKMEVCKGNGGARTTVAATVGDPRAPYKLDAKGKCHDVKGKMAAKAKCAA